MVRLGKIKKSVRTGDDGKPVDPIKAEAMLSVTPPPQMPATLEAGEDVPAHYCAVKLKMQAGSSNLTSHGLAIVQRGSVVRNWKAAS